MSSNVETHGVPLGPISPELVLVDPELADLLRRAEVINRPNPREVEATVFHFKPVVASESPAPVALQRVVPVPYRQRSPLARAALPFVAGAILGALFWSIAGGESERDASPVKPDQIESLGQTDFVQPAAKGRGAMRAKSATVPPVSRTPLTK